MFCIENYNKCASFILEFLRYFVVALDFVSDAILDF